MILNWLRDNQEYALIIVPLVAFLEAFVGIGIFVSGVILLSVCTLIYTEQIVTLTQMLPLAFLGATIADHSGYYLGLWIGPRFHHTAFAIKRRKFIKKSEDMIRRYGGYAIIFGRLMTSIRSVVPLLIGICNMPRWKYTLIDFTACAIWTSGLALLVVGLDNLIN